MTTELHRSRRVETDPLDVGELAMSLVRDAQHLHKLLTGENFRPSFTVVSPPEQHPRPAYIALDKIEQVKRYLTARRRRSAMFPEGLFADPAWDMLLDLFIARVEGRAISVTSICIAGGVPMTTALRWLDKLEQKKMIFRRNDKRDRRRVHIQLSETAVLLISAWIVQMWPSAEAHIDR